MKIAICMNCGTRYWSRTVPHGISHGTYRLNTHKPCIKSPARGPRVRAARKEQQ